VFSKAYLRESVLWIGAFVLTVEGAGWIAGRFDDGSPWRFLALVPVTIAIGAGFWVELRQIARMDELQRLTYLIAVVAGSMLAVMFCGVAYLGEALKLWTRVAPIYVIAVMAVGFACGWAGARRRYG
jgi:hypothetical protein